MEGIIAVVILLICVLIYILRDVIVKSQNHRNHFPILPSSWAGPSRSGSSALRGHSWTKDR